MQEQDSSRNPGELANRIKALGLEHGFSATGISRADVSEASPRLMRWLALGRHGKMDYMARHAHLRSDPQALVPGTISVISATLDYLPKAAKDRNDDNPLQAAISCYALGRDYHKVMRRRLQQLADAISAEIGPFGYRVFSDSAPVMEVEFARQAGLGWRGKHTLLLSQQGSWRFIGDIYTDLLLPEDSPQADHCGTCSACLTACPTGAIVAPYEVDARRCISYLTIELPGAIPEELRPLIGNRIYGCDDCQLCCPWNRFARIGDTAFSAREGLDHASLVELFAWGEGEFEARLAGSPIRRIGHGRWLRNIAVALGNAPTTPVVIEALRARSEHPLALVREHVAWALAQHTQRA
ncbi:MAG: tRNA epoxyqueuosine(34) reductase QueG [Betaproteobacteria bacterium]